MNGLRTMTLMVALPLLLVFVGAALGGKNGIIIALVFAFGMNFITGWLSDKIVLKLYRAHEVIQA